MKLFIILSALLPRLQIKVNSPLGVLSPCPRKIVLDSVSNVSNDFSRLKW